MKTKIIYISGNEIFEMADIRAAFDEVRNALNLDSDTVLFGVPVDRDNAIDAHVDNHDDTTIHMAPVPATDDVEPIMTEITPTPVLDDVIPEKPKKPTTKRTRAKAQPVIDDEVPAKEITPIATEIAIENTETENKVIPILSVLASKSETKTDIPNENVTNIAETITDDVVDAIDNEPVMAPITEINAPAPVIDITAMDDTEIPTDISDMVSVSIADMVSDDTPPVVQKEKTLEELLESMTPLREDMDNDVAPTINATEMPDETIDVPVDIISDDTDATLEQLAAEFVQNEDKIVSNPKNSTHGKIGKLKNILPFKKARREDSGLMGDLFGWAGIAANDEEFAIPGFFTNAAKK